MKRNKIKKKNFFRRFWDAFWRPEMLILPGQISFFLFLSLVPTITIIGYVCSYLNLSNDLISSLLSNGIGKSFGDLLTPIITDTKISPTFFITLGVGYFVASNGMSSIIVASNTVYGIKDSGFFRRRLKAMVMQFIIVLLFLFILIVPLLSDSIISLLQYFNLNANTTEMIVKTLNFLSGPFSWIIVFVFIKLIYTMAPDKKMPSRSVTGGAIFTTIAWVLITMLYSYYINEYANYSVFYGSLANIVILMLWVYLLSYALVIGMAMNYREELEKTGIIEVQKVIEESASQDPVMPLENPLKQMEEQVKEENKDNLPVVLEEDKKDNKKKWYNHFFLCAKIVIINIGDKNGRSN